MDCFAGRDRAFTTFCRHIVGHGYVPDGLKNAGASVDEVVFYSTQPESLSSTIKEHLRKGEIDIITFTSSSTVDGFFKNIEAGELLSLFNTDDDGLIWKEISENDRHKRFAYNILIHILLKYEDFTWARKNFISIVNNVTERKSGFVFEDQHFQLLFLV